MQARTNVLKGFKFKLAERLTNLSMQKKHESALFSTFPLTVLMFSPSNNTELLH